MTANTAIAIASATALAFLVACSSPRQDSTDQASRPAGPSKAAASRKIALPDLTGMAPPVQQQLRDQASALARLDADDVSPDKRAEAYGDMGKLLLAVESFSEAEASFLNASELNPSDVRWDYYLAHAYRSQGESQKAATYFERVLKARPDDVAALVWLGNMYLDQGRPVEAEPLFSRALSFDAGVAAAQVGLGRVSLAARDYTRAIEHLKAALRLNRGATSVHYLLASAYRGAGQVERADIHLRQRGPIQAGPPDQFLLSTRGQVAFDQTRDIVIELAPLPGQRRKPRGKVEATPAPATPSVDLKTVTPREPGVLPSKRPRSLDEDNPFAG